MSGLGPTSPVRILGCLAAGLLLGIVFPTNTFVLWVAQSGTWFPRTVVTFATPIIFILIAAALSKTLLSHSRASRFLGVIVALYVVMAAVSLVYVAFWIPLLTGLPLIGPDLPLPGLAGWMHAILLAVATTFTEQPLLQVLVAASLIGALLGRLPALEPTALGVILGGEWLLRGFAKLLWYYPIMIGCLAILIPSRFGLYGLAIYARTSLNLAIVALIWSGAMLVLVSVVTKRSWSQIWKYFATVYMTGFGTGGSYDTLAVNLVSAERDLGLRPEVARVSIVLGTVLNKNVATMAVLLVTVSTCTLLKVPISMAEIALLIPPVMILGLESPGIPGGAGVFMSPVIASLLVVPDPTLFFKSFVTLYSGMIPMLATAGNTTDDGFVGAIVNDCWMGSEVSQDRVPDSRRVDRRVRMFAPSFKLVGLILMAAGFWMLVAPQARLGLPALRWLSTATFRGEALVGAVLVPIGLTAFLGVSIDSSRGDGTG